MNTEQQCIRRRRAYWILLAALLLLGLWAWLTASSDQGGDGGAGFSGAAEGSGTGSGGSGNGSGSGPGGDGSGSGAEGDRAAAGTAQENQPKQGKKAGDKQGSAPQENAAEGQSRDPNQTGEGETPQVELPVPEATAVLGNPVPPPAQTAPAEGGSASGKRGFYGIPGKKGGKVLFLVDVSGSMSGLSREMPGKTLLDVLKQELAMQICGGTLDPTESTYKRTGGFIVISFQSATQCFPEKGLCRYRNAEDVKKGLAFVKGLISQGGTDMVPAWRLALERAAEEEIDTIYFLTDGQPGDVFNFQVFQQLRSGKKLKRTLTIHCIAIGCNQQFMKDISASTKGGVYRFLP